VESKAIGTSLKILFNNANQNINHIKKIIIMMKLIIMILTIKIQKESYLAKINNMKINLLNKIIVKITNIIMMIKIRKFKGSKPHMLQIYLKNFN
jgi:hypothetical protein